MPSSSRHPRRLLHSRIRHRCLGADGPYAKAKAGLSDASLGAVLLCLGLGSLLAMPLAGALTGRLGCRRLLVASCAAVLLALPLLALAPSPLALGAALFLFGAGVGAMDCTVNMQAVAVERDAARAMMSGFTPSTASADSSALGA